MKLEIIRYAPLKPPILLADILKNLPLEVRENLVYDSRNVYINVDANKKETIVYLDNFYKTQYGEDFQRFTTLEIDKQEIDDYDYFRIMPKDYQLGKGIFGSVKRPDCDWDTYQTCPHGSSIMLPLRVTPTMARRIGIGSLFHVWPVRWELLLSEKLKNIFEEEAITGLEFNKCQVETTAGQIINQIDTIYWATPSHLICDYADRIKINKESFCEKHSLLLGSPVVFGGHLCRRDLTGYDFSAVERIKVGNCQYQHYRHALVVSRKVVKLLLKNKISGLQKMGYYHDERFLPLMPVDSDRTLYNYSR